MWHLNISALNLYLTCPRKWYNAYVLERGSGAVSKALEDGRRWHTIMETGEAPADTEPRWMHSGVAAWRTWLEEHPDVHILARELELERPLSPECRLIGRIDALVEWNGSTWALQHKTKAVARPLALFQRLQARSYHEHAYRHLLEAQDRPPYAGCLLVTCNKLSDANSINRSPLSIEFLALGGDHQRAMSDIEGIARNMQSWLPDPAIFRGFPPQNPQACDGYFHNSPCEYLEVCDGHALITALGTIDPLEGYKTVEFK